MKTLNNILDFVVLIFLLLITTLARSEDLYLIVGGGASKLNHTGDNGLWMQEGYDYVHEKKTPTFQIGLGLRMSDRFRAEIDYRDLGSFNAMVRHTTDEAYDPVTHGCYGACPATQTGFIHSDAKGIAVSGTYDLTTGRLRPYLRGGLFLYTSKTVIAVLRDPSDPYDKSLTHFDAKREYSATPLLGAGACYNGAVCLEYAHFFKVGGYDAPMRAADTVTISLRMGL